MAILHVLKHVTLSHVIRMVYELGVIRFRHVNVPWDSLRLVTESRLQIRQNNVWIILFL